MPDENRAFFYFKFDLTLNPVIRIFTTSNLTKREKMNTLQTHRNFVIPVVGQGATVSIGSDCYPATVIEVSKNLRTVTIQMDTYTPAPGYEYFGNQVHEFFPNPDGAIEIWTLRNHGRYAKKGSKKGSGFCLSLNGRRAYSDPSF